MISIFHGKITQQQVGGATCMSETKNTLNFFFQKQKNTLNFFFQYENRLYKYVFLHAFS